MDSSLVSPRSEDMPCENRRQDAGATNSHRAIQPQRRPVRDGAYARDPSFRSGWQLVCFWSNDQYGCEVGAEFSTRGIIPHAIFDSGGLGVEIVRTWGAACCAPTLSFGEVTIAGVADCV